MQSVSSHIPAYDISDIVQQESRNTEDFRCVFCKSFVIRPVEIQPCKSLGCCSCCINVSSDITFTCPGCSEIHQSTASVFSKVSPIIEKVLSEVLVTCKTCGHPVSLVSASDRCSNHAPTEKVTLEELIQVPLEAEPTNLEKRAAASLVSRIIHHQGQGETCTVTLPRRGRVRIKFLLINFMKILLALKSNQSP